MSTWNYRIVRVADPCVEYNLYEVYYDDTGRPVARTRNPATLGGDTLDEAQSCITTAYNDAISQAVLDDNDIGGTV